METEPIWGHHQKPFQPADVHPGVLNLFCGLPRLLNSSREIASQITDEISSCDRHVDNSRFENFISVAVDQLNWDLKVAQVGRIRNMRAR